MKTKVWRYGIYLHSDDPNDLALIKALEQAAAKRRVGHLIRQALHAYLSSGSRAAAPVPVQTAMTFSAPPPPLAAAAASKPNVSVLDKARKAFMK